MARTIYWQPDSGDTLPAQPVITAIEKTGCKVRHQRDRTLEGLSKIPYTSVGEAAAVFATEILKNERSDAIILGHGTGAKIAWESSRWLKQAGRKVCLILVSPSRIFWSDREKKDAAEKLPYRVSLQNPAKDVALQWWRMSLEYMPPVSEIDACMIVCGREGEMCAQDWNGVAPLATKIIVPSPDFSLLQHEMHGGASKKLASEICRFLLKTNL